MYTQIIVAQDMLTIIVLMRKVISVLFIFSVRLAIEPTWLNDRDNFFIPMMVGKLIPNFKTTAWHSPFPLTKQNHSREDNHWIPLRTRSEAERNLRAIL
jgi:hypothetical protein